MAPTNTDPGRVIKAVLTETGSMVSTDELRSFIRQALSRGEGLDQALERCFEADAPTNSSAEQRERFLTAAEELWAREVGRFDPATDAKLAPLRDDVLALVSRIADWIRSLDERELDPTALPAEPMERLGEMSGMLGGVLEILNREDDSSPEEIENLRDSLGKLDPVVTEMIREADEEIAAGEVGPAGVGEPWVGAPPEPESVFVLEVSLVGIEPRVWRQVRVPGHYSLGDLHQVILVLMDWSGSHLHVFAVGERRFADLMDIDDPDYEDEELVTLDELGLATGSRFSYVYDFGDSWKHAIRVTRVVRASAFAPHERAAVLCTSGENAAPPEDCGGIHGYARLVGFDRHAFDIDAVNRVFSGATE